VESDKLAGKIEGIKENIIYKELKEAEKTLKWYKKASERPSCFKAIPREKTKK
jgi:hypothetical protein